MSKKLPTKGQAHNQVEIITAIGPLTVVFQSSALIGVLWGKSQSAKRVDLARPLQEIVAQIQAYFTRPIDLGPIPYQLEGSPFQKRVWRALSSIPLGETTTYGALARTLDTSPRAIGGACRTNPLPLVIPCHRVVASTHVGGFCGRVKGRWIAIKHWLLEHEESVRRSA